MVSRIQVKNQTPAQRCLVCHQSDQFNPVSGVCQRCAGLTLNLCPQCGHEDSIQRENQACTQCGYSQEATVGKNLVALPNPVWLPLGATALALVSGILFLRAPGLRVDHLLIPMMFVTTALADWWEYFRWKTGQNGKEAGYFIKFLGNTICCLLISSEPIFPVWVHWLAWGVPVYYFHAWFKELRKGSKLMRQMKGVSW